ncbi:MAG: cobalamin-binding protein [Alphaproteobacteria bacterium]|nr:cobalamin-binding protein [Alphaproteobacteria bacterium]
MTEETTETLYLLGEERRIVGISGYTVRPPRARREKPRVSAFISADSDKIMALEPDLVLGFSDLQAEIAGDLVRRGLAVHVFNHRSIAGILGMIRTLGALVGAETKADALVASLREGIERTRLAGAALPRRPRVYFEEWDDPMIAGIRWTSELVQVAGGEDCFPELAAAPLGRDRIVRDPAEVIRRAPDVIIGSWCGKRFRPERVVARPGWAGIPAVRDGELHEVKSALILQPGPAALTDGLAALHAIMLAWAARSR